MTKKELILTSLLAVCARATQAQQTTGSTFSPTKLAISATMSPSLFASPVKDHLLSRKRQLEVGNPTIADNDQPLEACHKRLFSGE